MAYVVTRPAAVPMPEWATGEGGAPAATSAAAPAAAQTAAQSAPISTPASAQVSAAASAQTTVQAPAHSSDAPALQSYTAQSSAVQAAYTAPLVSAQSATPSVDLASASAPAMLSVSSVFTSDTGYGSGASGFGDSGTFELAFTTQVASGDPIDYSISGDASWLFVSSHDLLGDWFFV